jgi:hypothetical protein
MTAVRERLQILDTQMAGFTPDAVIRSKPVHCSSGEYFRAWMTTIKKSENQNNRIHEITNDWGSLNEQDAHAVLCFLARALRQPRIRHR